MGPITDRCAVYAGNELRRDQKEINFGGDELWSGDEHAEIGMENLFSNFLEANRSHLSKHKGDAIEINTYLGRAWYLLVKRLSWEMAGLEVRRTKQHLEAVAQEISHISLEGFRHL